MDRAHLRIETLPPGIDERLVFQEKPGKFDVLEVE